MECRSCFRLTGRPVPPKKPKLVTVHLQAAVNTAACGRHGVDMRGYDESEAVTCDFCRGVIEGRIGRPKRNGSCASAHCRNPARLDEAGAGLCDTHSRGEGILKCGDCGAPTRDHDLSGRHPVGVTFARV